MHWRNEDLHGNAPDKSEIVLLLIDVINDFDFPEGKQLFHFALPMAGRIAKLAARARAAFVPVVYVNDNFGRWRSDLNAQVEHCLRDRTLGQPIVELLRPESDDYFVLKPKHSGFFSTTLDTLLEYLGVTTVVLAGVAANICVLFTANDAYMRDLRVIVPSDCVASNTKQLNGYALEQMRTVLKAVVSSSSKIRFPRSLSRVLQKTVGMTSAWGPTGRYKGPPPQPKTVSATLGSTTMAKYGKKSKGSVKKAMHKKKKGSLKSGKSSKKVKSKKQAIAIGLSEARKKEAKVPRKKKKK